MPRKVAQLCSRLLSVVPAQPENQWTCWLWLGIPSPSNNARKNPIKWVKDKILFLVRTFFVENQLFFLICFVLKILHLFWFIYIIRLYLTFNFSLTCYLAFFSHLICHFWTHIHKPLSFEHVFRPSFCLCRKSSAEILMFSPVVPSISLSSTSVRISSPNLNFPRFHSVQLQSTSAHPTSISLGFTQFNFSPHQLTPPQFPRFTDLSSASVHISSPNLNFHRFHSVQLQSTSAHPTSILQSI